MTQTAQLRAAAQTALTGTTAAGTNVFSPLDRPTWAGNYPVIFLSTPEEQKESLGRQGAPQFTVTATLQVIARVAMNQTQKDAGAAAAMVELEKLQNQIEVALINNPALMDLMQQFSFVRVTKDVNGDGESNLGELKMDFGLEFYQGPEDFFPIPTTALETVTIDGDLQNVFDPNGTYPNPPFPASVEPAPRDEGPDGRMEVGADITLPQE